jgi:hypothetical protein
MAIYYCHACAVLLKAVQPLCSLTIDLTGTQYQLEKFLKHTAPANMNGFISVYDDPSYPQYKDWSVTASLSGCVEIDDASRKNIIWYAGKTIGVSYDHGTPVCRDDTVKLVLPEYASSTHSFPVLSGSYLQTLKCNNCGCDVIA